MIMTGSSELSSGRQARQKSRDGRDQVDDYRRCWHAERIADSTLWEVNVRLSNRQADLSTGEADQRMREDLSSAPGECDQS
jgi:hypothetical protein